MSARFRPARVPLAQHAEAAGVGDRDDNILAVAESEDRELDPEQVTHARLERIAFHGRPLRCIDR